MSAETLKFRIGYRLKASGEAWTNHAMEVYAPDVNEATRKVRQHIPDGVQVRWTRVSVRCTALVRNRAGRPGFGTKQCGCWVSDGGTRCPRHPEVDGTKTAGQVWREIRDGGPL